VKVESEQVLLLLMIEGISPPSERRGGGVIKCCDVSAEIRPSHN